MKLSFVIPAYNVDKYIERCIKSIKQQSFQDYEVIVIDDGSTDGTASIVQAHAQRDARIRLFSQTNSGQGAARNYGVGKARGEYIWFVDGDDWIVDSVLARITRILTAYEPEVMVINFEFAFDDHVLPSSMVPSWLVGEIVLPRSEPSTFATISCWNTPPWRLITKRQHLIDHGIEFAEGLFYEDHPFAIHLMLTAKSVYVDGCVSYSYYQRKSSTTKVNDHKALDFISIRRKCLDIFHRYGAFDDLVQVVIGYIAPINFYKAHVGSEYKKLFVEQLSDELKMNQGDVAYVKEHGDQASKSFIRAVQDHDLDSIERQDRVAYYKAKYSVAGIKRLLSIFRFAAIKSILRAVVQLKYYMFRQATYSAADDGGKRFVKLGVGARLDEIYIDVRLKNERRPYVIIGDNSQVGGTFVFERGLGQISIGRKSSVGGGCKFICTQKDGIVIGNNVMIAWGCTVMDSNAHSLDPDIRANDAYDWKCGVDAGRIGAYKDWSQVDSKPIFIDDGAWLGFETAVLKGVRIGKGSVVGARSVVASDVAPFCVYAGVPARFLQFVPRDRWSWEEIIDASQENPAMKKILVDAYLDRDLAASLVRYRSSAEFKEILSELRRLAPNAQTILDVGAAGGIMAVAFAIEGYTVTVIEPSTSDIVGVEGVRNLLDWASKNIDPAVEARVFIHNCSIEEFAGKDKYDLAYCRQVVHHFRDPEQSLKKIQQFLFPGAYVFLVREHVILDEDDKNAFLSSHPFHVFTGGENAYTAGEYREFIRRAGLELVHQYGFADTIINCYPHDKEYCMSLDERAIAGRPYTFVAKNAVVF